MLIIRVATIVNHVPNRFNPACHIAERNPTHGLKRNGNEEEEETGLELGQGRT